MITNPVLLLWSKFTATITLGLSCSARRFCLAVWRGPSARDSGNDSSAVLQISQKNIIPLQMPAYEPVVGVVDVHCVSSTRIFLPCNAAVIGGLKGSDGAFFRILNGWARIYTLVPLRFCILDGWMTSARLTLPRLVIGSSNK
ncbi:hypothetical protein DFJ77DRAFT_341647 [Powellomyces hirtus]|nr:hypothetical protein DFJ77DRAFT_341647 [Powellomyces hirtus]